MRILKTAALELESLNNSEVVKAAGVVRRIKNWYKKMTDPAFREEFLKLQEDAALVKNDLEELYKYINETQKSIKDSDIESYNYSIDKVRELASKLVKEVVKYKEDISENKPILFEEKGAESLPSDMSRIEAVHISNAIRTAVWNIRSIKNVLSRHNIPENIINEFIGDPNRMNQFYDNMAKAIKNGEVVDAREAKESKEKIERHGERQYRVITAPFEIPGTNYKIRATVEGIDLSTRRRSPYPKFSVKSFNYMDARQALRIERIIKLASESIFNRKERIHDWSKKDKENIKLLLNKLFSIMAETIDNIPSSMRNPIFSYYSRLKRFVNKELENNKSVISANELGEEINRFGKSIYRLSSFTQPQLEKQVA